LKSTFRTTAKSVAEVREIGALLASELRPGDAVGLSGGLGAGKTTLVQAIVRALHGDDDAASPTFTFRHIYPGQPPVEHLDLYRIETPGDAAEIGLEEAFRPDAVVLVEWPERLPGLLPANSFRVTIEGSGDEPRSVEIERPR
jgi:tRNA threonylcarbamoyl adenosine modification protein YjeE